jgi:hypothetical protein
MGMVAALALETSSPFKKVAHLRFVDSFSDSKLRLAVSKSTVLAIFAVSITHKRMA